VFLSVGNAEFARQRRRASNTDNFVKKEGAIAPSSSPNDHLANSRFHHAASF
jgi:hypothetical protein